ncbi:unnamed protein product [Amoebophrya sp. A120]|nr:unnamed protein product [Amoebophrya sp. A120]|eukprot:GSA120T00021025001.1
MKRLAHKVLPSATASQRRNHSRFTAAAAASSSSRIRAQFACVREQVVATRNIPTPHVDDVQGATILSGTSPACSSSSRSWAAGSKSDHEKCNGSPYITRRFFATTAPSSGSTSSRSRSFSSSSSSSTSTAHFRPLVSCEIELTRAGNKPGALGRILSCFEQNKVDLTHVESKLHSFAHDGLVFLIDFKGKVPDTNVQAVLQQVKQSVPGVARLELTPPKYVPWFPASAKELDRCVIDTIGGDSGLIDEDHPGFQDESYKKRRQDIAEQAASYKHGEKIPHTEYTAEEIRVWNAVYDKLTDLHQKWACDEYNAVFPELAKEAGYGPKQIPQLHDISEYCFSKTGFRLRPVCGLLSARDFLNALAFRTFCSTQYIRHGGNPFYTPEPDICHELIGHVPLLADPDFADFTQRVGLASLGASDEEIVKLASIYWFTVEFGLVRGGKDNKEVKAMGAGILSSFGEMEWAAADKPSEECRQSGGIKRDYPDLLNPKIVPFDPRHAAVQPYPITTYQPIFFCGDSLQDVKEKISDYCDGMERSFHPVYDFVTQTVQPSRHIRRLERSSTADLQAQKQKEYFAKLAESRDQIQVVEMNEASFEGHAPDHS